MGEGVPTFLFMRVEYDQKHDIMNIEFLSDVKIAESEERDGVIFDYTKDRKIVSIEILDVSKRISRSPLEMVDFAVVKDKSEPYGRQD